MTRTLMILAAVAAVGCTAPESSFRHQSELGVNARGVALGQEGLRGQVGMYSTTCAVDTRTATVGSDLDFEQGDETVHDNAIVDGRETYLIASESGLHLQDATEPLAIADAALVGLFDHAFLYDAGAVGFVDGELVWTNGDSAQVGAVSDLDVAIDGVAYLADGDIREVTPIGERLIGSGDLIAHDDALSLLYAASTDSTQLDIMDRDGTLLATADLPGMVRDITALGDRGQALLVLEHTDGTGELMVVDGLTGQATGWVNTPAPADAVTASGDGRTIAITVPGSLHFFHVD